MSCLVHRRRHRLSRVCLAFRLDRERLPGLLQMFSIMIADVIRHPLQRYLTIHPVDANALPLLGRGRPKQGDQFAPERGELREGLVRILTAVITLDRPERIVEAGQRRPILIQHSPISAIIPLMAAWLMVLCTQPSTRI